MKTVINHLPFTEVPKIPRGRGIVNHLIASKKIGARNIHSGITFIPPKTSVPDHYHNTEEQVTIIKGSLKIILNGDQEVICNSYDSYGIHYDKRITQNRLQIYSRPHLKLCTLHNTTSTNKNIIRPFRCP